MQLTKAIKHFAGVAAILVAANLSACRHTAEAAKEKPAASAKVPAPSAPAATAAPSASGTTTASAAAPVTPAGSARPTPNSFFTQPDPIDFNDHEGYVSLFDGKTLKGWDGHPKFWRVEDGAIVGESTKENPSGNSYLVYKDMQAHDFTLKFEVKVDARGGTGIQYRSRTGVKWLGRIRPEVEASAGPLNLDWMQTGPQADFWPARVYTGQFYTENDPMRIVAWRGQVVESYGAKSKRLMGNIGTLEELGKIVKPVDWNEYVVIARGPVCMHIVNGQLMAVLVDDDPNSTNNWSGEFGIEIEAITKVYVRNIWVKKLN